MSYTREPISTLPYSTVVKVDISARLIGYDTYNLIVAELKAALSPRVVFIDDVDKMRALEEIGTHIRQALKLLEL